jgi:hypothetical protein
MFKAARLLVFLYLLYAALVIARSYIEHPNLLADFSSNGLLRIIALALAVYGCVVLGFGIYRSLVHTPSSNADGRNDA